MRGHLNGTKSAVVVGKRLNPKYHRKVKICHQDNTSENVMIVHEQRLIEQSTSLKMVVSL
jgi:hypothetical protein